MGFLGRDNYHSGEGDKQFAEVVIFGSLHMVLLASAEFGERTAE
jgi:hypothetical protein